MSHSETFHPAVIIFAGVSMPPGPSANMGAAPLREHRQPSGTWAGQMSGANDARGVVDPFRVRADFPELWSRYIRANFRSVTAVIAAFEVSERTARKWWDAETGASGGHVAVACRLHPQTAPAMLFAAE